MLEGPSKTKVTVSWEEQSKLEIKVANYTFIKSYELQNIDKYTLFMIINTRGWRQNYLSEIRIYDDIYNLFIALLDEFATSAKNKGIVYVPSKLYNFEKDLPEYTSEEVLTAFHGHLKIIENTLQLGADDIITSEILNKFLGENKIDQDFWEKAFTYFKNKDVIKKYKKGKKKHLPDTLEELMDYPDELPKELISYAATTTYNLGESIKKKKPFETKINEYLHNDEDIYHMYDQIREIEVQQKLPEVIEKSLTTREKEVIDLQFYENLTQQEIAEELKISQPAVSKHLSKALEKMRKALKK